MLKHFYVNSGIMKYVHISIYFILIYDVTNLPCKCFPVLFTESSVGLTLYDFPFLQYVMNALSIES